MSANNNNGAVIQVIRLKNGETVKGLIIVMMDREFIIQEAGKAIGTNRLRIPIYEVEYKNQE
jgi:hypothetical protein